MGAIVGPRRALRCGATLWLSLACALTGVAAAAPAPGADPQKPAAATPQRGNDGRDPTKPRGLQRIPRPLPTSAPDMLILADALVRLGHVPEARVLLQLVIANYPDTGWSRWGQLGLGFLELARGRMDAARPYYQAAAVPGFSQDTASVVLALLDAQAGNTAGAIAVLDTLAHRRRAGVQQAAAIGAGYARYWAGDYEGAAVAFAAFADTHPQSPLADDALYGLAQSFIKLNDPKSAEQVLERINELPTLGFDDAHVRPALRGLAFRELLRATRERYTTVPLGQADQMLIALLDINGRVLAKGSLASLAKKEGRADPSSDLGKAARDAKAALARIRHASRVSTDAPMGAAPTGPRDPNATMAKKDDPTQSTAPAAGPADARTPGGSDVPPEDGGGGGLVLPILLIVALYVIRRRWGFPTFRRAASRPAGR